MYLDSAILILHLLLQIMFTLSMILMSQIKYMIIKENQKKFHLIVMKDP